MNHAVVSEYQFGISASALALMKHLQGAVLRASFQRPGSVLLANRSDRVFVSATPVRLTPVSPLNRNNPSDVTNIMPAVSGCY